MSYKSIFTVWDGHNSSRAAFSHAISRTVESQGHLHVLCPVYLTFQSTSVYPFVSFPAETPPAERESKTAKAATLKAQVNSMLENVAIDWSVDAALVHRNQISGLVQDNCRYADLTILPCPYGAERNETDEQIAEGALFSGQSPVLVIPQPANDPVESTPLIAWDGSTASFQAVKTAIPLLARATHINVVNFSQDNLIPETADLATDINMLLSRHRLNAKIEILPWDGTPLARLILTHAKSLSASLLVMGGYGHSPLREFIFGGVTREILKAGDLPVWMAH